MANADEEGFIGPVTDVAVGDHFSTFQEIMKRGVHGVRIQGIWPTLPALVNLSLRF